MKERAFVLRRTAYRDADLIITFLGETSGKFSAIARQARASRKRFAGTLEPFSEIEIALGRSRGKLPNVSEARVCRSYRRLLVDLNAMTAAGDALGFARAILPEQHADPESYALVAETLSVLDQGDASGRALQTAFKLRMLSLQGYRPELEVCALSGRRAAPGQSAYFDPRLGSVVSRMAGGAGLRLSGALRDALILACSAQWAAAARRYDQELSDNTCDAFVDALVSHQVPHIPSRSNVRPSVPFP